MGGPCEDKEEVGASELVEWRSGEKVDNVNFVNLKQYFGGESPD